MRQSDDIYIYIYIYVYICIYVELIYNYIDHIRTHRTWVRIVYPNVGNPLIAVEYLDRGSFHGYQSVNLKGDTAQT